MATAMDGSSISQPSEYCNTCEDKKTDKYCNDCEMSLCGTCIKLHDKVKGSADHIVRDVCSFDVHNEGSQIAMAHSLSVQQKCLVDPSEVVKQFCKDCVEFTCGKCSVRHEKHNVETANVNNFLELNRKVCTKERQNLMEAVQNLEEYNTFVDACTDNLRGALQKLTHEQDNVKMIIDESIKQVTKITTARSSSNSSLLWNEAAAARVVVEKVMALKTLMNKDSNLLSVDAILQNLCCMETITKGTRDLSMDDRFNQYTSLNLKNDIVMPNSLQLNGYNLCKRCPDDKLILHACEKSYIRCLDLSDNSIVEAKSDRSIVEMVMTGSNEFLIVHGSYKRFCLLDSNFICKDTTSSNRGFDAIDICKISDDRYLFFEISESMPYRGLWKEVCIHDTQIAIQNRSSNVKFNNDKPLYMSFMEGQRKLVLCSDKLLYTFEYPKTRYVKHSIQEHTSGDVRYMTTDGLENILVGDINGNIHLFDQSFHAKLILQSGCSPNCIGVGMKGYNLIITTVDNRLLIYDTKAHKIT